MKYKNLIWVILTLIFGYFVIIVVCNNNDPKKYELIITDEFGKSTIIYMVDVNNDGSLEFHSYKK